MAEKVAESFAIGGENRANVVRGPASGYGDLTALVPDEGAQVRGVSKTAKMTSQRHKPLWHSGLWRCLHGENGELWRWTKVVLPRGVRSRTRVGAQDLTAQNSKFTHLVPDHSSYIPNNPHYIREPPF